MKAITTVIWLAFGLIGASGQNAKYQYDPDWWQDSCYAQSRRYLRDEMVFFSLTVFGPLTFVVAAIDTGLFNSGWSFHFGIPARCHWAHK